MSKHHWGSCLDCGEALGKCWFNYGRNTARVCPNCDKYMIKGKMITRKELGF